MIDQLLSPDFVTRRRQEARQAEILYEVAQESWNRLAANISFATIDTVVFEYYRKLNNAHIWREGVHREWLTENVKFITECPSSAMVRYIIVPYPCSLKNHFERSLLRDFIIEHIHLHLWHGVICAIKFLDPREVGVDAIFRDLNFFAIPKARLLFDFPGYYQSDSINEIVVTGSDYFYKQKQIENWMLHRGAKPIWLFYSDEHFEVHKRLRGWHWDRIREFFFELNHDEPCPGKGRNCLQYLRRSEAEVDHIGPFSEGFPQTLRNFQLLCRPCNREKGPLIHTDPLISRIHLPDYLKSEALKGIERGNPPWLGINRPPRNVTILSSLAGIE